MNYDFIRKLAVKVSEQEAGAITKLLLSHNIETYAEGTSEERKRGRSHEKNTCTAYRWNYWKQSGKRSDRCGRKFGLSAHQSVRREVWKRGL